MSERSAYGLLLYAWCGIAPATFLWLLRMVAPYGRHARAFGPTLHRTVGWIVMEAPSPLLMAALFVIATHPALRAGAQAAPRPVGAAAWALFGLWELHYLNRAFVFPLRMRGGEQRMPLAICASGFFFNCMNAYLNGRWLTAFGPAYAEPWFFDPRFGVGVVLFVVGAAINLRADAVLRALRGAGDGYQIPRGGLYQLVSCPNYFGELIEWTGWAIATWSLAGLSFALWTAANLVPRARAHHRWYRTRFADYPPERRAILPFLY